MTTQLSNLYSVYSDESAELTRWSAAAERYFTSPDRSAKERPCEGDARWIKAQFKTESGTLTTPTLNLQSPKDYINAVHASLTRILDAIGPVAADADKVYVDDRDFASRALKKVIGCIDPLSGVMLRTDPSLAKVHLEGLQLTSSKNPPTNEALAAHTAAIRETFVRTKTLRDKATAVQKSFESARVREQTESHRKWEEWRAAGKPEVWPPKPAAFGKNRPSRTREATAPAESGPFAGSRFAGAVDVDALAAEERKADRAEVRAREAARLDVEPEKPRGGMDRQ